MNHKNIIKLISAIFFIGIIFSSLSLFMKIFIKPEIVFMFGFIVLTIVCIIFFHIVDIIEHKPNHKTITTVINKNLYIYHQTKSKKINKLFS